MKTFRQFTFMLAGFVSTAGFAQTVGDASLGSYSFSNDELLYTGTTSHYHPKVFVEDGESEVFWGHGSSGDVSLFHTSLTAAYESDGALDTVVVNTGLHMSDANSHNHMMDYDASTGKYLSAFMIADKINVVQNDFSLMGKLYTSSDFTPAEFYIEGPFDYTSDAPNRPDVATNGSGQFCVAYHSNSGSSTSSVIRIKMVDATSGTVTPAPSANTQTGTAITFAGAQFPSIAYNAAEDIYGIVFITGAGANSKVKFVSVDATGTVVTSEKDVIAGSGNTVAWPQIQPDGDGFVIMWQDFRPFHLPPATQISGMPQVRIARITDTGDLKTMLGADNLFDATDNSLILSNPYTDGSYIHHDLITITAGEKYAAVWATQDNPLKIQMTEIHVTPMDSIKAMIPIQLNTTGQISDKPTIAFDGTKYIVAFNQYNGSRYENRIAVGTYIDPVTASVGENEWQVKVYPNPSTGQFFFSETVENVTLLDAKGRVISTHQQVNRLNIDHLEEGVYFVKLNNAKVLRLIKQ
jgi:hypothetical protein